MDCLSELVDTWHKHRKSLTYNLDYFSQQDSISHILLQILYQPLVTRFCQIVISPIRINLLGDRQTKINCHS